MISTFDFADRIFIAEDLTLKGKSTNLKSNVKSSKIMQLPLSYIPSCLIDIAYNDLVLGCQNSVIPTDGSVILISRNAFSGCSSLISIIYNGTIEQWKAIIKRDYWNSNTGDYTITFSDGTTLNKSDDV